MNAREGAGVKDSIFPVTKHVYHKQSLGEIFS